jgi:hypothetical protein
MNKTDIDANVPPGMRGRLGILLGASRLGFLGTSFRIFLLKVVGVLLIVQAQMRNLLLGDDLQLRVLFGTQAIIGFSFFSPCRKLARYYFF